MMSERHTPGRLVVRDGGTDAPYLTTDSPLCVTVVDRLGPELPDAENQANAARLAAAWNAAEGTAPANLAPGCVADLRRQRDELRGLMRRAHDALRVAVLAGGGDPDTHTLCVDLRAALSRCK